MIVQVLPFRLTKHGSLGKSTILSVKALFTSMCYSNIVYFMLL